MQLGTLLHNLSVIELKDLYVGGSGKGAIPPSARCKLITYTNEALKNIYMTFPIFQKEVVVKLLEDIAVYTLDSDYALSNKDSTVPESRRYIEDNFSYPFIDDILAIKEIYNITGSRQDVNNRANTLGINILGYNQIQVPAVLEGERLVIVYDAYPDEIPHDASDEYVINIPRILEEAVRAYVAYMSYSGMNVPSAGQKSGEMYMKYQNAITLLSNNNVFNQHNTGYNERFALGGFV